jgi:hypothetical protein
MNRSFEKMTYAEFEDWCNKRACDGQWSMSEAITCISIVDKINSIRIKGLFKKKATNEARESAWRKWKESILEMEKLKEEEINGHYK